MHSSSSFVLLAFLVTCVQLGASLQCYSCNSNVDEGCADPDFNGNMTKMVDCETFEFNNKPITFEANQTFCRKTVHRARFGKIFDYRTIRTCGYEPDDKYSAISEEGEPTSGHRCITRAGTFELEVTYCTCDEDGCNTGSSPHFAFAALSTALLSLFRTI